MKKIKTLFKKNPKDLGRVINEIDPENLWVLKLGVPTQKFDGTACAIIDNRLYKRFDLKKGRKLPDGAIPCQEPDLITGHHPHWIPCRRGDNSNKYHFEAFEILDEVKDGTFELCGPKVNGNRENLKFHELIQHGGTILNLSDFSFSSIKKYLEQNDIEGIVFHEKNNGKRMCKIRKSDFGIKR